MWPKGASKASQPTCPGSNLVGTPRMPTCTRCPCKHAQHPPARPDHWTMPRPAPNAHISSSSTAMVSRLQQSTNFCHHANVSQLPCIQVTATHANTTHHAQLSFSFARPCAHQAAPAFHTSTCIVCPQRHLPCHAQLLLPAAK